MNAIGQRRKRGDRTGSAFSAPDPTSSQHASVLSYPTSTYDGNGNVSEYLNSTSATVAHYEQCESTSILDRSVATCPKGQNTKHECFDQYDAFGNTIDSKTTGAKANDFAHRFSTKPLDSETGFYYYGYRYYDPHTSRWLRRDPIEEQGGVNLYEFVGNDSINGVDYLGLQTKDCTNVSFSVSYNLKDKSFPTGIPFIFVGVGGSIDISVSGEKCKECCDDGSEVDYYDISASVSGSATLTVTAGIQHSQDYGAFSVNVWGGVQGSGGGSITGNGNFKTGCNGNSGNGSGSVSGSAGLRVGAEASFTAGRWSLGKTGVSGGGSTSLSLPYTFTCDADGCDAPSFGGATTDVSLDISACAFGFCFTHTF